MGGKARAGAAARWAFFLRGVNVGGRAPLAMARLRALVEGLGGTEVATYIQSGNVVFSASGGQARSLQRALETALEREMGFAVPVVLRSSAELAALCRANPFADTNTPDNRVHAFLSREPPTSDGDLDPGRFAPDEWRTVGRDLFARYPSGVARSKLTLDVLGRAYGASFTGRNLRTLARVAALAGDE